MPTNDNTPTGTNVKEGEEYRPVSASVAVSIDVLNTSLVGVYNKKTEKVKEENHIKEITEFLVMPTDSPKGGMTIRQLIDEVNKMIASFSGAKEKLDDKEVKDKLALVSGPDSVSGQGILDRISVELRQIFLYQNTTDTYEEQEGKKGSLVNTKKSLEYAINFVILSDLTNSTAFNIKSISIGVWNTTRPSVLNRMQIGNVQSLLGS